MCLSRGFQVSLVRVSFHFDAAQVLLPRLQTAGMGCEERGMLVGRSWVPGERPRPWFYRF